MPLRTLSQVAAFLGLAAVAAAAPDPAYLVSIAPQAGHFRVEIGGRLFTEYVYAGGPKDNLGGPAHPYCYPILAPDGTPLTRNFPMRDVPGEDRDHPWHRALYFAHSDVGGVDFWNEGRGDDGHAPSAKGRVVQDPDFSVSSGPVGVLRTADRWLAPDGRLICTDTREIRFHASAAGRFIDFDITLHARPDAPLLIGDNKDGTMAIRIAQWMTLPHKYRGAMTGGHGHILDAAGDRDNAAWGKRADWCDYSAPHDGRVYGVAIFDAPTNLRHPTWWMARDYGLFGANPFGEHDFERLADKHAGDYTVPAGGALTLRYRFFFHEGGPAEAGVASQYAAYAQESR